MSKLRNNVQLIGNVGNDPIIKTIESGEKVAEFSMATNENYKNNKGEKTTKTEWHNILAWNKTAEIIEKYVKKGEEIAVSGKLTYQSWEDESGVKKYKTVIRLNEVLLLGKK